MKDTANLQIVYLAPEELTPYENNARKHGEEDVAAIIRSIEEFGFDDPIGIWGESNIIVEGHGRLEAAKTLGMASVPCIRLDHLTEDQRKAYALAHNKTAELSGWDFATLEGELNDLDGLFDMADFGFVEHNVNPEVLDELFAPAEDKEKEPKRVQCPHCGEWFTP